MILDEQDQRCVEILGSHSSIVHGDGSSGAKSKKCVVAAACIGQSNQIERHQTITCSILFSSKILKMIMFLQVFYPRKKHKQRIWWSYSPLSKTSGNPISGSSSAGATGAGCGARSNGQKTCPVALRAALMLGHKSWWSQQK